MFLYLVTLEKKIKSKQLDQLEKYIILFPFCSPHLTSKKWPYYNDLINKINEKFNDAKFILNNKEGYYL